MRNALNARRCAAVLVILAAALWWHRWAPALIVVAFVLWVILHKRLESEPTEGRQRAWRRVWPPPTLVLVVLIAGGTALYSASSDAIEAKILPVALNAFAAFMVVVGIWRRLSASPSLGTLWSLPSAPSSSGSSASSSTPTA